MRAALLTLAAALALAGCGAGGDKIEPEKTGASGSPLFNKDKAPKAPAATTP